MSVLPIPAHLVRANVPATLETYALGRHVETRLQAMADRIMCELIWRDERVMAPFHGCVWRHYADWRGGHRVGTFVLQRGRVKHPRGKSRAATIKTCAIDERMVSFGQYAQVALAGLSRDIRRIDNGQ